MAIVIVIISIINSNSSKH
uniref:Uncharacterized protein n=1 Tax=Anguilla anguilla TaxID=7936 RepID=A0A0E9UL24_ANGAN